MPWTVTGNIRGPAGDAAVNAVTTDTEQTVTGRKLLERLRLIRSATAPVVPALGEVWVDTASSAGPAGSTGGYARHFLTGGSG